MKTELPDGIDPKKFIEKIVTIRKNLPIPQFKKMQSYAAHHLISVLGLREADSQKLADMIRRLSLDNPRRQKILVLRFIDFISSQDFKRLHFDKLASILLVSSIAEMGFLVDERAREIIDGGDEDEIIQVLTQLVEKHPEKKREAMVLTKLFRNLQPRFVPNMLVDLRLISDYEEVTREPPQFSSTRRRVRTYSVHTAELGWKTTLLAILSHAALQGFELSHMHACMHS